MFRHFHARSFAPAWAGADPDDSTFISHRFQHGKHGGRQRGEGWGDDRRARRGDIKFILLELLCEHPRHGYDLIKDLETRHGGLRRLSPGSVYPTLQMLEDGGYLTSQQESGKRIYTVTESGRSLLAERVPSDHPGASRNDFENVAEKSKTISELRNAATQLADVVMQVARSGNLDRMNQVRELLDRVKRDIYLMLAEK